VVKKRKLYINLSQNMRETRLRQNGMMSGEEGEEGGKKKEEGW
jgi:hypothetical protein